METYPVTDIVSETLAVFVVSTTGTGKEPRAMTPLWNMLLRSDLPPDLFEDLEFAVFGLGDTAYEKFCWPAKKLSRRLESLGATEICPRGEGDDQHTLGVDGALGPWIEVLTHTLLELFPLPSNLHVDSADALPPPRVSIIDALPDELIHTQDPLLQDVLYHNAKVLRNERITAEDWYQDVRHFELQCEDDIAYEPGDVAVIHPEASPIDVDSFLTTVGWANDADQPIRINQTLFDQSLPDHLPPVSTLRTLFSRYLDVNAVPRRSFFDLLRHFTTDDREREKLDEFVSTPEGAEDMYDYTQRVRRTIREVLEEFRSARIPKAYIFDLFPRLRPREFSIASSVQRHPHEIHLCVAIVAYRTKLKIPRRGLCTTYLAALRPGALIPH
ncbi:hypothetical protein EWM64_g9432 [Hericium alpestre]|uniref:Flavodoxin-like domain-containing protein n=1 Tax=Hericium alpestre TaxID=135208 RepID=A0A4Y9ZK68_9AGAM|nr:hypothetical protein EWM64_g9432 [Hericium alpestre]